MDFRLPPLGEGIDTATVVAVKVKLGDTVSSGQDVLDVETDKAAVPVQIDQAATITQIHVKPGDKIAIGATLFSLSGGAAKPAPAPTAAPPLARAIPVAKPVPVPPPAPTPVASATGPVEFKLPPMGEGIDSGTVVGLKVKIGDTLKFGQDVLDIETDKAAVSVQTDVAGVLEAIHVKQGDKIAIGTKLLTIIGTTIPSSAPAPTPAAASVAKQVPEVASVAPVASAPTSKVQSNGVVTRSSVAAGPATRRLARELGVSLLEINGTARGGRITLDDVKGFVRSKIQAAPAPSASKPTGSIVDVFTHPPLPDFSKYGEIEKKPVSNIRQTIAKNLTVAWRMMPMVTQNDIADITDLEAGRKRIVDGLPKEAPKITWTVLAVKAVVAVLKEFPNFNSSYDMNAGELIQKKYFHIGIAVDTERGLVVPVLRDADKKSIRDVAIEIAVLAKKAREGKLAIDEMRGGTFTITNLGGIGGTSFTPIVNYPEVAILGLSRSAMQPVVKDGQIVPRLMMPLSLTYDHRVIDGADGARFTTRLVQLFSDPMRLLMES
jgi:pyruvate dehydrogenase E2 component (dihydrolipoamide acetyltransferase)